MRQIIIAAFCLMILSNTCFSQIPNEPSKESPAELLLPAGHGGSINSLALSKDDHYIFSSSYSDGIKIWETKTYKLVKKIDDQIPSVILPHATNDKIMLFVSSGYISFFDLDQFKIVQRLKCDSIKTNDAVMSSDGRFLYLAGSTPGNKPSMRIYRLDLSTNLFEGLFDYNDAYLTYNNKFTNISINSTNTELVANAFGAGDAYIVNCTTKELLSKIAYTTHKVRTFSPDDQLVSIEYDSKKLGVKVIDRTSNQLLWQVSAPTTSYINDFKKTCVWNKNQSRLIVATMSDLIEIDFLQKQVVKSVPLAEKNNRVIAISNKSDLLFAGIEKFVEKPAAIMEYNASTFSKGAEIGLPTYTFWDLKSYQKEQKIVSVSLNGFAKNISFRDNGLSVVSEKAQDQRNSIVQVAPGDQQIVLGSSSYASLDIYRIPDSFKLKKRVVSAYSGSSSDLFYSADGSLIAAVGADRVAIIDAKTDEVLKEFPNGYYSNVSFSKLGAFSKNKKSVVFFGNQKDANGNSVPKISCYNVQTGDKLWEQSEDAVEFNYAGNDQVITCLRQGNSPAILTINALTGQIQKSVQLAVKEYGTAILSPDSKYYFVATKNDGIQQFDATSGQLMLSLKGHTSIVWGMDVLAGNQFLISGSQDNTLRLWDLVLKKEVAKILLFENNNSWVIMDPNGRFDASPDAMNELYYVKGKDIIPLDALYEKFFTPLLLANILKHKSLPAPDVTDIKQRPVAKISYEQITRNLFVADDEKPIFINNTGLAQITIKAFAQDDTIDEIRLFHNGKAVSLATRGLFVADEGSASETKNYTIQLLPGENNFKAVALNSQRTESVPDEIMVKYQVENAGTNNQNVTVNAVPVDMIDKSATLHLLVVGINKYQNAKMSLNYALADATSFKDEIENSVKTVLGDVRTYFVTDDAADKNGIVAAFAEVKKNAKPSDVFVFYYAGHGVISEKNKEFYLVPTDVADLKNVDLVLEQKGIPSKLLQSYAIDIQAQKQLFILDACQSAGAFETMIDDNGNQQKNMAVVARSTGTHWMAASGSKQFANEFSSLGHGVFTYVLLQALKGEAMSDKMITVNGLKNFIQVQVPVLMKKYGGTLQYPSSYGFGKDFPVEIVK